MISLAAPPWLLHSYSPLPCAHASLSLPPLLPPSGALTKETWLSQRPTADLLIHSLCPFYVLLQTYLQRRRGKREEGGFEGRSCAKAWSQQELCSCCFFLRCDIVIKCLSSFLKNVCNATAVPFQYRTLGNVENPPPDGIWNLEIWMDMTSSSASPFFLSYPSWKKPRPSGL